MTANAAFNNADGESEDFRTSWTRSMRETQKSAHITHTKKKRYAHREEVRGMCLYIYKRYRTKERGFSTHACVFAYLARPLARCAVSSLNAQTGQSRAKRSRTARPLTPHTPYQMIAKCMIQLALMDM